MVKLTMRDKIFGSISIVCWLAANIIYHVLMAYHYHQALTLSCTLPPVPPELSKTNCTVIFNNPDSTYLVAVDNVCNQTIYDTSVSSIPVDTLQFQCYYNTSTCYKINNDSITRQPFDQSNDYQLCLENKSNYIYDFVGMWGALSSVVFFSHPSSFFLLL